MKKIIISSQKCTLLIDKNASTKICRQFKHSVGVVAVLNSSARGIVNGIYLLIKQSILQIKHMFLHIKI